MKISKLISGILVLTLAISSVFGFSSPKVFAITNDGDAVITKNNKNERIAESIEGEYKYIGVWIIRIWFNLVGK